MNTRYKNWIKNAETPDENDYVVLPYDEKKKRRVALIHLCFCFLFIALQIVGGLVNQASSRTAWIFYPYIVLFLPIVYFAFGASSFVSLSFRSVPGGEPVLTDGDPDATDEPDVQVATNALVSSDVPQGGLSLSRKEWEKSLARCSHSVTVLLVFAALNALLVLVYVFTHLNDAPYDGALAREFLYLAVHVCIAISCVGYGLFFKKSVSMHKN